MNKKTTIAWVAVFLLSIPVFAEPDPKSADPQPPAPALPDGGIDVTVAFVTNYVWRGDDIFFEKFQQDGKMYKSFQSPGAFQPSITFKTGVDGLTFNIWGSLATSGRQNVDSDGRIQRAPGGDSIMTTGDVADITTSLTANPLPTEIKDLERDTCSANTAASMANLTTGVVTAGKAAPNCAPNTYKEKNGLKRWDEIDFTLGYSKETKKGTVGMGFISYTNPVTVNFGQFTELYVSYAPPFLSELSFTAYSGITGIPYQYYMPKYAKNIDLTKSLQLNLAASAGYKVQSKMQGWNDVTGLLGVTFSGIAVSINAAYRPDMRFHEAFQGSGDTNTDLPVWINGGSTTRDGFVADPSKSQGLLNDAVNGQISQVLYGQHGSTLTYTPRAKLPSVIYWASIGYTTSF